MGQPTSKDVDPVSDYSCNGICLHSYEIGLPGSQIAYAHPDCDLHGSRDPDSPEQEETFPPDVDHA